MKIDKKIVVVLAMLAITTIACKKEYEDIGLPPSKLEGLTSKWVLSTFFINDKAGIVEEKMDMTDYYTSGTALPNITFSILAEDTLFTCDTTGLELNLFDIDNGRWRFDDNNFPTKIIIMRNDKTPISELNLLAPIRSFDKTLQVSKNINCSDGKTVYSYDLVLNRISN